MKKLYILTAVFIYMLVACMPCQTKEITFTDAGGSRVVVEKLPERVVSLVPSITEIIFALGADDAVKGITFHSTQLKNAADKAIVGGYFQPSIDAIFALEPDMVFVSSIHDDIQKRLSSKKRTIIETKIKSVAQSMETINLLGKIFNREKQAAALVESMKADIDLIAEKISHIDSKERKRVMRLMGRDKLMTPGKDSFQNEMIRLAGGIPPDLDKPGNIVEMTKQEWISFNPQVVYGCGKDSELWDKISKMDKWKQVDAVRNNQFYSFPCDLTCRAATQTGNFIKWLSSTVYSNRFASRSLQLFKDGITQSKPVHLDLDFVKQASIVESRIFDFNNQTLIIDFKKPMTILSTLEGWKTGVKKAGNHYTPPQSWLIDHKQGLDSFRKRVLKALDLKPDQTAMLFTGAEINNLAVTNKTFKELSVWALVTAGVESNAMRAGKDRGLFYEPGTINIIVMANMQMSKRAMTRAIITATEAKTAALMDMDIRSSYADGAYRATGTGTDNVLVVQGTGQRLDNAGGHTRLGELIAKAVTQAVKKAVYNQNGLTRKRDVFKRLKKRGISIYSLLEGGQCDCGRTKNQFVKAVEKILLKDRYQGFIETAFAVSDDFEKGLVKDLSAFELFASKVAEEISGRKIDSIKMIVDDPDMPHVLRIALNAIFNGIYHKRM